MSVCRTCRATILWALSAKNGRRIPLDPGVNIDGNLVAVECAQDGTMIVAKVEPGSDPAAYVPHFATCPNRPKRRPPSAVPPRHADDD